VVIDLDAGGPAGISDETVEQSYLPREIDHEAGVAAGQYQSLEQDRSQTGVRADALNHRQRGIGGGDTRARSAGSDVDAASPHDDVLRADTEHVDFDQPEMALDARERCLNRGAAATIHINRP
jgi:hypothetical protein